MQSRLAFVATAVALSLVMNGARAEEAPAEAAPAAAAPAPARAETAAAPTDPVPEVVSPPPSAEATPVVAPEPVPVAAPESAPAPEPSPTPVVAAPIAPEPAAPAPAAQRFQYEVHGSYRISAIQQSDLVLGRSDTGSEAETLGQQRFFDHRLRLGGKASWGDLSFDLEFDLLNGLINVPCTGGCPEGAQVLPPLARPDGSPVRADPADPIRNRAYGLDPLNAYALRKASLQWRSKVGQFSIGATTNQFGLGLLANGSSAPIDAELADQRFGDRVLRASFATKPLQALSGALSQENLTALVGLDLLLQDETGALVLPLHAPDANDHFTKDVGLAFVLALRHQKSGYSSGLFFTHRAVTSRGATVLDPNVTAPFDARLSATVVDLFADYKHPVGAPEAKREWFVAGEGAVVFGSTNAVRNASCPGNSDDSHCAIVQGGGVVKAGIRDERISAELLGGYASGDGNPFDGKLTNFRFDRDFKAGLILFDQVMAWQTAAMVRRAGNPALVNVPSAGLELLSTSGAITNALFLQPTVKVKVLPHTQLVASALFARAPQPFLDPYWTNRTSVATNPFGAAAGQSYGAEFDVGANYVRPLTKGAQLYVTLAGGYFVPGDAFRTASGGPAMPNVYLVKARTAVTF